MSHQLAQLYTPAQIFNFIEQDGATHAHITITDHTRDHVCLTTSGGKTHTTENIFSRE
jgi:hypothetical protein